MSSDSSRTKPSRGLNGSNGVRPGTNDDKMSSTESSFVLRLGTGTVIEDARIPMTKMSATPLEPHDDVGVQRFALYREPEVQRGSRIDTWAMAVRNHLS